MPFPSSPCPFMIVYLFVVFFCFVAVNKNLKVLITSGKILQNITTIFSRNDEAGGLVTEITLFQGN